MPNPTTVDAISHIIALLLVYAPFLVGVVLVAAGVWPVIQHKIGFIAGCLLISLYAYAFVAGGHVPPEPVPTPDNPVDPIHPLPTPTPTPTPSPSLTDYQKSIAATFEGNVPNAKELRDRFEGFAFTAERDGTASAPVMGTSATLGKAWGKVQTDAFLLPEGSSTPFATKFPSFEPLVVAGLTDPTRFPGGIVGGQDMSPDRRVALVKLYREIADALGSVQ